MPKKTSLEQAVKGGLNNSHEHEAKHGSEAEVSDQPLEQVWLTKLADDYTPVSPRARGGRGRS